MTWRKRRKRRWSKKKRSKASDEKRVDKQEKNGRKEGKEWTGMRAAMGKRADNTSSFTTERTGITTVTQGLQITPRRKTERAEVTLWRT